MFDDLKNKMKVTPKIRRVYKEASLREAITDALKYRYKYKGMVHHIQLKGLYLMFYIFYRVKLIYMQMQHLSGDLSINKTGKI